MWVHCLLAEVEHSLCGSDGCMHIFLPGTCFTGSLCEICCVVELCLVFVCVLSITLCTVVEQRVVCYFIVSDIGGHSMMICTYHYRMESLH